jgi:hypothetical protein
MDVPKKKFNPELRAKFDVAIKQAIDSSKEAALLPDVETEYGRRVRMAEKGEAA